MSEENQTNGCAGAGKDFLRGQRGTEKGGWRKELQRLIDKHAGERLNGKVASSRTREATATELFAAFNTLHDDLGFKLQNPKNLSEKHIQALVNHWYRRGLAPSTMRQDLSLLRKFSRWIGKDGMVRSLREYLPTVAPEDLRVSAIADRSLSWSENGVDIEAKIVEADGLDEKMGLMLRMAVTFGLRRKELLMLKPWKSDVGHALMVYPNAGPKGGRPRVLPITDGLQRAALDFVKERTPKTHHLGWYLTRRGRVATLEYNCQEYLRWMRRLGITRKDLGVTGHGLRAEFAENQALLKGLVPATLGGKADQLPKDEILRVQAQVSESLGHSRLSVTNSYYGSFRGLRTAKKVQAARAARATPRVMEPEPADPSRHMLTPVERRKEARRLRKSQRDAARGSNDTLQLPLHGTFVIPPGRRQTKE